MSVEPGGMIYIVVFLIDKIRAEFAYGRFHSGKSLFSPVRSVDYFTTGFFRLLGLRKRFGRLHRYFAHVVSSISLTFCYLLKQSGLFSFKRSVK